MFTVLHIFSLLSRVEQTSGVVVDVGHGVATCCVVWEGEERPGPTSADPLTCSAPVVAQMVHSLVAQCSQDMRDVIRERVVVTGEPEFMYVYIAIVGNFYIIQLVITWHTLKLLIIAATNFSDFSEKPHNREIKYAH